MIKEIKDFFKDVRVEKDTKLKKLQYFNIENLHIRYERWSWEGIIGETCIFLMNEIQNIEKSKIIEIIENEFNCTLVEGKYTVKKTDEFMFYNFNFESY
jgi:hypothetical protein